jgi:hypothetical protein
MMHSITHATFPEKSCGLSTQRPRVRHARQFRVFLLAVAVLLGSTSMLHAATATWNPNPEPDIAGYILSYGTLSGVHPTSIDVGNVTTWQLTTLTPGQIYFFVLQAYNSSGLISVPSAEVVFTNPGPVATPPTLTQPPNQTSAENAAVSLQLAGSDPDGDALTYSATGLPPALSVNAATGLISGTLAAASAGTYRVTATVSDGSLTDSKTFTWTVTHLNRPPTLMQPPNRTSATNATVSLQLLASDPDGDPLTYSATGLPAQLTVNSATGLISGTLVSSVGPHTVTATVSDGRLSSSQTFSWTVTNVVPVPSRIDFDGDGKTDPAVYEPATGTWWILYSGTGYVTNSGPVPWGLPTDQFVPGDYDGDGETDPAVFRPSTGQWLILESSTSYAMSISLSWGGNGATAVPADYDGDGKIDPAVYFPATGQWWILYSSTSYTTNSGAISWGGGSGVPVPGDYDGDGKTDPAVYFPATGQWWILYSRTGYTTNSGGVAWGGSDAIPVPGDYDGDGKVDPAVYFPVTGQWWILYSSTHYTTNSGGVAWGGGSGVAVPGDYDGDGMTDPAVYFPATGQWWILYSRTGYATNSGGVTWGGGTGVPISSLP